MFLFASKQRLVLSLALLIVLFEASPLWWGASAVASGGERHPRCEAASLPVALVSGASRKWTVAASLCQPRPATDTVLVTYHGNSYAGYYWDFPYQPERYSFVNALVDAGYAVYHLDRLPVDHSYTHPNPAQPPSSAVTIQADNYALHQVVQALRAGTFGNRFSRVVLVGHSLGGYMAWQAGKDFPNDFDGFVITGSVHPNSQAATKKVI